MLTKTKKKNPEKLENDFFSKNLKYIWGVAKGKPQLKFERSLLNRF